jgi:hypothetical protein
MNKIEREKSNITHKFRRKVVPYALATGLIVASMGMAVETVGCAGPRGPQGPQGVTGERGPQGEPGQTVIIKEPRCPEIHSTPTQEPDGSFSEDSTGFVINHFEPGQSICVGENAIITADATINGVDMFDNRSDTGEVIDVRVPSAQVFFKFHGDIRFVTDMSRKAEEVERARQDTISNDAELGIKRRIDVITYTGVNQQLQR